MNRFITKAKTLLLSLSLALFAVGLAVPPQALNAACYQQATPPCPDTLRVIFNAPPGNNPSGEYNCYGVGTYNTVVNDAPGGAQGYSMWSPGEEECTQNCYRYVNQVQYMFTRTVPAAGQMVLGSAGCQGSPPE